MQDPESLPPPSMAEPSVKDRLLFDVPAGVYIALVFIGASIPWAPRLGVPLLSMDKMQHLLAFGGLQLLLHRAVQHRFMFSSSPKTLLVTALASTSFGALIELWQTALPYRSGDWADLLADTIGVALACVLIRVFGWQRRSQPESP